MRILIVGCGAVGGYFGERLLAAGADVTYYVHSATAAALRQSGLVVRYPTADHHATPAVVTTTELSDWAAAAPPAAVWITVKCHQVAGVLDELAPLLRTVQPALITCQNGLGTEELIAQRYPAHPLIAGVAYVSSEQLAPGIIRGHPGGWAAFGPWTPAARAAAAAWVEVWQRAGIRVRLADDIRNVKWAKLCWNAVFNALTAGLQCPLGEVLDTPALRAAGEAAMREVYAVARAEGIVLDEGLIAKMFADTEAFKEHYTSMYVDLAAGRPTEIDWINGAVIRRAQARQLPVPVNQALRMLVRLQERRRGIVPAVP